MLNAVAAHDAFPGKGVTPKAYYGASRPGAVNILKYKEL
jgi:hypothetical protein